MSSRHHLSTVFVLGGGGTLGAVQVGMLYALLGAGIKPDGVVGTSIGALNGAFLAGHPDLAGIEALAGLWESVRRRDVFPVKVRGLLRGAFGHQPFLFGSLGLRRMLHGADLGFDRVEEAPIPLRVVATDLRARKAMVLDRGDIVPALLASSAIPGVYPPVEIDGRTLVDGGIVANTPIAQAEAFDPEVVYVLPTLPDHLSQVPANALIMMQRVMALAGFSAEQRALTEAASRREVRVLPVPETAAKVSIFDFRATSRLIDEAYLLTTAWLRHRDARRPEEVESLVRQVPGPTPVGAVESEVA
jgi:NTE family protein